MDPAGVLPNFDPLDALEKNVENAPIPGGVPFQDPLCQMLDKLERDIELNEVKPPPMQEELPVLENPSQDNLPSQGQTQETGSERGTVDLPPLPYYTEILKQPTPFHSPPYRQGGRIGRRGGRNLSSSESGQGGGIYCPFKQNYVVFPDFCEDNDCKYYDYDSDQESSGQCTYCDEERA